MAKKTIKGYPSILLRQPGQPLDALQVTVAKIERSTVQLSLATAILEECGVNPKTLKKRVHVISQVATIARIDDKWKRRGQ